MQKKVAEAAFGAGLCQSSAGDANRKAKGGRSPAAVATAAAPQGTTLRPKVRDSEDAGHGPTTSASAVAAKLLQQPRLSSPQNSGSQAVVAGSVEKQEQKQVSAAAASSALPPQVAADPVEKRIEVRPPEEQELWSPEQLASMLKIAKLVVPLKHLFTLCLLLPAVFSECRDGQFCVPFLSVFLMCMDIMAFTGHLGLGLLEPTYRKDFPFNNFWLITVFWSVWNLFSHPFWRENIVDLLVVYPDEIHLVLNVAAVIVCSHTAMLMPSWRHLAFVVISQFFLSFALSEAEVFSSYMAALDRNDWVDASTIRMDLVIFNLAILGIGSMIVIGSMTADQDWKGLSIESEPSFSKTFIEDDLERRKRAVLTALCDTVLSTNLIFAITSHDENAERMFKRSMLNEIFMDYLKDQAEKDKFIANMKKQFPEDESLSDGPKRQRVSLRDCSGKIFDADVVVSDAGTDPKTGKVNRLMIGMHVRAEYRAQTLAQGSKLRARESGGPAGPGSGAAQLHGVVSGTGGGLAGAGHAGPGGGEALQAGPLSGTTAGDGSDPRQNGKDPRVGSEDMQRQLQREFSQELLAVFADSLRDPGEAIGASSTSKSEPGGPPQSCTPKILFRRANCESYRRRSSAPLGPRAVGERHVDLRRLSLPEPASLGTT